MPRNGKKLPKKVEQTPQNDISFAILALQRRKMPTFVIAVIITNVGEELMMNHQSEVLDLLVSAQSAFSSYQDLLSVSKNAMNNIAYLDRLLANQRKQLDEAKLPLLRNALTNEVIDFMAKNDPFGTVQYPKEGNVAFLKLWVSSGKLIGNQNKMLNAIIFLYVKPFASEFVRKVLLPMDAICDLI